MTTKTLELSTNLIGVEGIFCSYWGNAKSEYVLHEDIIQDDFDYGYTDVHPDYYYLHFDNKKYMHEIHTRVVEFLDELLTDVFRKELGMDVTVVGYGYHQPREYNFGGDIHNFNLSSDSFQPLIDHCIKDNAESFGDFLKENYTSYDGFMSWTPNSIQGIIDEMESDPARIYGAMVRFLIQDEIKDRGNWVHEALSEDMFYSEFVDYDELDEFKEEIKNNSVFSFDLDEEWKTELFKRELFNTKVFTNRCAELYVNHTVDDTSSIIADDMELEVELVYPHVKNYYESIKKQTLELKL